MRRTLTFWIMGFLLAGPLGAQPKTLAAELALRLDFSVKATMKDRVVHTRPSVMVLDQHEAQITLESSSEEPPYKLALTVMPRLGDDGQVEMANHVVVVTASGEWSRRLKFTTLLGTSAEFSFNDEDGTEIELTVRPTLVQAQ